MFNLFRPFYSNTLRTQDKKLISISNFQDFILMSVNYSVQSDSPLVITRFDNINHEQFYIFTGIMPNNDISNYDMISFTFDKNNLTSSKSSLCIEYGCSNFDMENFLNSDLRQKNITYILQDGDFISTNLWNNFRLLALKDSIIKNIMMLTNMFMNNHPIDFETDLKGYIGYHNLLKSRDNETLLYV